jgi:hypothetical protein
MRVILIAALLLSQVAMAQKSDSAKADSSFHDPTTATVRSAILPGLGQIYNKKYWKVPIIYGGLGASGYFILRNTRKFREFRSALVAETKGNAHPYQGIYNEQQLTTLKETYRRWRDLSYISLFAVYVLQVVDANVDAHLYEFDVSEDLSLRIRPWSGNPGRMPAPSPNANGFSFSVRF